MVFIIATEIQITHPLTGHSWLDLGLKILYTEQKFTNLPSFLSFAYLLFIYATEKKVSQSFSDGGKSLSCETWRLLVSWIPTKSRRLLCRGEKTRLNLKKKKVRRECKG